MEEIKHVYEPYRYHGNDCGGWGAGGIAAAAVAFAAVGGLAVWAGTRRHDDGERYMAAKSQGLQEAGIACTNAGIAEIKGQLSAMQTLENIKCCVANGTSNVINGINVAQQKTDTGLAVIANSLGATNALLNRTLGNCFVYSKPICDTTTTTTAVAA